MITLSWVFSRNKTPPDTMKEEHEMNPGDTITYRNRKLRETFTGTFVKTDGPGTVAVRVTDPGNTGHLPGTVVFTNPENVHTSGGNS